MPTESKLLPPSVAIRLENVTISYRGASERMGSFKEYLIRLLQRRVHHREFLAVKDVSLDIQQGEVFGLVGNNGAGKSTLLKVIAKVLTPSKGRVRVNGRVSPLLELGAGFHPELSGRENVFLNGALLGYSQAEMRKAYDEIVSFSELEAFMETPIRNYSSGMAARLGFAVATAYLPDILILDEILSVGDEAFQRKSFERILAFREQGATVLMVSHALNVMGDMCNRMAWLDHGVLRLVGQPAEVLVAYRQEN